MALIAAFLLTAGSRAEKRNYRKGSEHGSARWGSRRDILPYMDKVFRKNAILSKTEFLTMDSRPSDWTKARNKNILVVGGSGSGKTRNFIKPNIMQMHSSYVVTDPKAVILSQLGSMLLRHGYKIKVFDLIDMRDSMKYNPFHYCSEPEDILKLVETLIENTNGEGPDNNDFWTKAERLLYGALISAIIFTMPEKSRNMGKLVEILGLMVVREEEEGFMNPVDEWFMKLEEQAKEVRSNPHAPWEERKRYEKVEFAIQQHKMYKLAAGKTAKSILISCAARLGSFNIPRVKELTSRDEMDLTSLGKEKTALFVIIPDSDKTFNFLVSIMYTQLFNKLVTMADKEYGGRLPVHVRCMLDEFANIGKIPSFEQLIATIRSREISACIVVQTKSQLRAIYKDHAETITGNCDTEIFLGGKEPGTLKDLAEALGRETIDDLNLSESRGQNSSVSQSHSKLGHDLMGISELATLDRRKCIVQLSGEHPFLSDKYDIREHPMYGQTADGKDDALWFDAAKHLKAKRGQAYSMGRLKKRHPMVSKATVGEEPIVV
jgi:type IV secretion system protein VirD4